MSILDSTPVGPLAPNASWTYTFPDKITAPDLVMPLVASPIRVTAATRTSVTFQNVGAATAPVVTFWLAWFYGEITREEAFSTLGWQGGDLAPIAGTGILVTGSTVSVDTTVISTISYVDDVIAGGGLLPPDQFDVARWKFDEAGPITGSGGTGQTRYDTRGPFLDDIGGYSMNLLDTLPYPRINSPNSETFQTQVPGVGNHDAFGFWGGTATEQRDYLHGAPTLQPAFPFTISMWVRPWGFSDARAENILMREYFTCDAEGNGLWQAPFVTTQMFFTNGNDGTWGATVTTSGTAHSVNTATQFSGFRNRCLALPGLWNHMGFTYDGATLSLWINGLPGPTLAVSGAVDYANPTAEWIIGANPSTTASTLDHLSASFSELRFANIVRPASWWVAMYKSLVRAS
jgi:hypothetical protein